MAARRRSLVPDTRDEADAAKDLAAHDVAPVGDVPAMHVQSPAFVRGRHPDHGHVVTYTPGEALPAWVVEQLPHASFVDGALVLPDEDEDEDAL